MALPEPSSKDEQNKGEAAAGKVGEHDDKDFDPSAEALIDEIDDERTLEEEEALDENNVAKVQEELDDLKKESEMPIEELLAYYERMRQQAGGEHSGDDDEEDEDEEGDDEEDEENEEGQVCTSTNDGKRKDPDDDEDGDRRDSKRKASSSNYQKFSSSNSTSSPKQQQQQHTPKQGGSSDQERQSTPSSSSSTQLNNSHSPRNMGTIKLSQQQSNSTTNSEQQQLTVCDSNDDQRPQTTSDVEAANTSDSVEPSKEKHRAMTQFLAKDDSDKHWGTMVGDIYKSFLGYDDFDEDSDDDYSLSTDDFYEDESDWRRVIHVGPEHQAEVPEDLTQYDDLPPYENEDKLIWKSNGTLNNEEILDYLKQASLLAKRNDISISSASVPRISVEKMRIYRERMQDITSTTASTTTPTISTNTEIINPSVNNQITSTTELPIQQSNSIDASHRDVYMSQKNGWKQSQIELEIEQENVFNQLRGLYQNHSSFGIRPENSDSTAADNRPELSTEEYFQDEEQLLFLLLQCNYNINEALRRRKMDPYKYFFNEPMTLWSQEECLGFEHGLRLFGKDFLTICRDKVPTRTHAEVVAFYYLWKKSERHDVYTNQYKLDRKRCLSHPGTTDYMDKFIEDNESVLNVSSTPTPTPTESTLGADSMLDRSQMRSNNLSLNRQQTYLQPMSQDPLITAESDTCPENKCPIR